MSDYKSSKMRFGGEIWECSLFGVALIKKLATILIKILNVNRNGIKFKILMMFTIELDFLLTFPIKVYLCNFYSPNKKSNGLNSSATSNLCLCFLQFKHGILLEKFLSYFCFSNIFLVFK